MAGTLVTGGAGFIGSHVVRLLLEQGRQVTVLDNLVEQVHGPDSEPLPNPDVNFVKGDVRDSASLTRALRGVDSIIHLAAEVGVGQSMYQIAHYVESNTGGTASLLQALADQHHDVSRLVVASSMSVYGEGSYVCPVDGTIAPKPRPEAQLAERHWEIRCPQCGREALPQPTTEGKPLNPCSVYTLSKLDQEVLCLTVAPAYGIGAVALRYFNTYGPGQALSNPYTGVAAIFSSRLLNHKPPLAFEDGLQLRDFIHVDDVARATVLALGCDAATGRAVNVGVGKPISILDMGRLLAGELGIELEPKVIGTYRTGDIRHCYTDTTLAEQLLGFRPSVTLPEGIAGLIEWVRTQEAVDGLEAAFSELQSRGLAS